MNKTLIAVFVTVAAPVCAENTRQMDAHEHGVGQLNIAVEESSVVMEFHAPGADIVGFEHPAEATEDKAAIERAIGVLSHPLDLFIFPENANCSVKSVHVALENEEGAVEHGHNDDVHKDHDDYDDHEVHKDHDDHDDHEVHKDHDDHDNHAGHNDHDDHQASHTEFHAEYSLECSAVQAISNMRFNYFSKFENAQALDIQVVTVSGAKAFDVERDQPSLELNDLF